MQTPVEITFRGIDTSPAVEARVRDKAAKLEQYCGRMTRLEVVVEARHQRHHKGGIYHVRIDATLPGGTVVASREPHQDHAHEDVYVAVRDAFYEVTRQIEDRVRRLRGDVKSHEVPAHGRVRFLNLKAGYGFIAASNGEEVYFHRNSVADALFNRLAIGDKVRYVVAEAEGEEGPQASTVTLIGKHHLPPVEAV